MLLCLDYKLFTISEGMEVQLDNTSYRCILKYLVFCPNLFMINTFLSFLDQQQIASIAEVALGAKRSEKFYRIAVAKMFVGSYLNRVDRSIFFLFYEEPEFQNIEKHTINALAYNNFQFLEKSYHSFHSIIQELSTRMSFLEKLGQFRQIIQAIFFEPDLPMPKMKRETIGIYCQTAFQQFLSLQRFQEQGLDLDEWLEDALQELKNKLDHQVATGVHLNLANTQKAMETVRFRGWLVNAQDMQYYMINGFHSHNLLVLLLALSSELVSTYYVFLQNITDPFMKFIEFNLRSAIYRNIILSIEERLGFLIDSYDSIYGHIYHPPPAIPKFNFWRAGFSIWEQKMSSYHAQNSKIYDYITAKLRENSLLRYLSSKTERLPSVYSELREEAELNGFSEVLKDQAYLDSKGGLEIEGFFDDNLEMYQVLAKDYLEYSVDMSINEITVHWCGHSQQPIGQAPVYREIALGLLANSEKYYKHLESMIKSLIPPDLQMLTYRQILKEDLLFIAQGIAKPLTLRQISNLINVMVKQFAELIDGPKIFIEELFTSNKITIDFQEKDTLLSYFAAKAGIPHNCTPTLMFFYCAQADPNIEIPKIEMEEESDLSDGQHQVYDSGNESL